MLYRIMRNGRSLVDVWKSILFVLCQLTMSSLIAQYTYVLCVRPIDKIMFTWGSIPNRLILGQTTKSKTRRLIIYKRLCTNEGIICVMFYGTVFRTCLHKANDTHCKVFNDFVINLYTVLQSAILYKIIQTLL